MKKKRRVQALLIACLTIFVLAVLAGCGSGSTAEATRAAEASAAGSRVSDGSYDFGGAPSGVTESAKIEADSAVSAETAAPSGELSYIPEDRKSQVQPQSGLLTAGEWNDNENFDFFQNLLNENKWYPYMERWSLFPTSRYQVRVTTKSQQPVKNAKVELISNQKSIGCAVTDANGMAYLYYNLDNGKRTADTIKVQGKEYSIKKENEESLIELITDKETRNQEKTLDLMFMIDTTGSMSDELEYLKVELEDVINQVSRKNAGMKIRLSVNFYRDAEDEYIIRPFPFTEDIPKALLDLQEQYSAGGGDYPEAVAEAMDNGVNKHKWEADSIKLMFWVLDAPPHLEREGVVESINRDLKTASIMGIHMIPVASSGVDEETEFLLRAMAATTGGTYTFLTDDSGVGESHLEPTIGDYEVELLNKLLVRLINQYCE